MGCCFKYSLKNQTRLEEHKGPFLKILLENNWCSTVCSLKTKWLPIMVSCSELQRNVYNEYDERTRKNPSCCFVQRNCSKWRVAGSCLWLPTDWPRSLCWVRGLGWHHTAEQLLKTAGSSTLLTCQHRSISLAQINKQLVNVSVIPKAKTCTLCNEGRLKRFSH